jgi:integrase
LPPARAQLSGLFTWALAHGLCEGNPVVGTLAPKGSQPRNRVLSDSDLSAIWKACGDDDYGRIVRLLIMAGCMRQEVGSIAWSEIDLGRGVWVLPAARSKNGRQHVLPLLPAIRAIIEATPKLAAAGGARWAFRPERWVAHDLRRTVATKLADIGIMPHIIEQALNHQSGHKGGVAGIYNGSTYEREVRNALAIWHDHLRSIVEGGERKIVSPPQVAP